MDYKSYVRNPFRVQAVELTEENLFEAAEFIGTIQEDDNGSKFILVDRRLVPNVYKVTPGYWMTKLGKNVRCFPGFIFKSQFLEVTDDVEAFLSKWGPADENPASFPEEGKILGVEENAS